ncbi:MAG: ferritin family protein [Sedimentibacter sp.]
MYKDELTIISQAVLNEIEGYEFYKLASAQSTSEGTKEAFLELATEEEKHADYLKKLWAKLSDGGEVKINSIIDAGIEIPSPEIYRWNKVDKNDASMALSIFGIGMKMEQDSIKFYEEAKEKVSSQAGKELFDILINWEKVHLLQFSEQYNLLKEDWWTEQGFAPF